MMQRPPASAGMTTFNQDSLWIATSRMQFSYRLHRWLSRKLALKKIAKWVDKPGFVSG